MKHVLWVILIITGVTACSKAPLNRDKFTALLIDMHSTDGILTTWRENSRNEKENYLYYNDLFKKYGINRADFDSCITYYSGQSGLFNKIYEAVIDTLSRRQTEKMRIWKQLTLNDTINLFPGYTMRVADTSRPDSTRGRVSKKEPAIYTKQVVQSDTVSFDTRNPYVIIELDSITPGMYKFVTNVKFDKLERGKKNYIRSYFLSANNDTLKVRDEYVRVDTNEQNYRWNHYVADSIYTKLIIKIVETENDPIAKIKMKGNREGKIWDTQINKTYVSPNSKERLRLQYLPRETK